MTTKINIDVKFKTPEAAALGFGLLYHAAGIVQSGCRRQLNEGMADEAVADGFIAHALRDEQARAAATGLAGRIMQDSLRALADGLDVGEEAQPIALDREPAQIVRYGLVGLLAEQWVPAVEILRGWSADLLESAAAWVMSVHDARRTGQVDPLLPRALVIEIERGLPQPTVPEPTDEQMADLLGVSVDVVKASNERNRAANRRLASELGLEAVWCDGKLTFQPRAAVGEIELSADEIGPEEDEAERMCTGCGVVDDEPCRQDCPAQTSPAAIATYEATGEQRVRIVVDGVTMWASAVTIERIETPPAIGPDDFTEDDGAIEFYADGEYNTTTVERLRLRIESRDEGGGVDFTLYADGELHDGCSSLTEVANSYPNVAPTIDAWKAGRTVSFAVVVTAARKLAGLTEPLPEETA